MTLKEIETKYDIRDGVIQTPGEFEGEPYYVPHLWHKAVILAKGQETEDALNRVIYFLDDVDHELIPELKDVDNVLMWKDDENFVYCRVGIRVR